MKNKRPVSVTTVAWILIIFGSLDLYSFLWAQHNPHSLAMIRSTLLPIQVVWMCIATMIYIIIGVYLLRGDRRARTAYLIVFLCGLGVRLIHVASVAAFLEMELALGVMLYFLYTPTARAYFAKPSRSS